MDYSLKHYQTIFKENFEHFDKDMTDYLITYAGKLKNTTTDKTNLNF